MKAGTDFLKLKSKRLSKIWHNSVPILNFIIRNSRILKLNGKRADTSFCNCPDYPAYISL